MNNELLFEIGTEEIPAGFIPAALENLKTILGDRLLALDLPFDDIRVAGTPRRLCASIRGLAARQEDKVEEFVGPPKKAAFDASGKPTKAAEGFAKTRGVAVEALSIVSTPKGEYLMAVVDRKGEPTDRLLADLLPMVVRDLPFPKSMRWASGKISFARPIQWFLARYNNARIPFAVNELESGDTSRGHRFMAPESFVASTFDEYRSQLSAQHVLVDPAERREAVRVEVAAAAKRAGGTILPDEELLDTVTNLVEKPFAVCGSFEDRFLVLPKEVLITSMREHQKYFAVADENGKLLPCFIAVNNTGVQNESLAVEGHQRVLRARLEDALFFFREDRRTTLADRADALSGIIFQRKLGTMKEKTVRVTALAGWLAQRLAPESEAAACRAASLAKADLLTNMVGEFPSLQGVMGREYARIENESDEVAIAIHEHYLPIRAGGALPTGIVGAIVSLADRIDTVAGCFGIGETPSGTADPFGLRRLTIGLLYIIENKGFTLSLAELVDTALSLYSDKLTEDRGTATTNTLAFLRGRFINDLTARGISAEAVEAACATSFDDAVDCRRRIDALVAVSCSADFTLLASSFKRVRNIIKDHADTTIQPELLAEPAEQALHAVFTSTRERALPLIAAHRYEEAMTEILGMKEAVDGFFDQVMVMTDDQAVRHNRLALLTAISQLFFTVGDFSRMYKITS